MSVISSVVNFKENLSKNAPYYSLLSEQLVGSNRDIRVYEHAALAASQKESVTSIICEGYQFVIAFSGTLYNTDGLFSKLSALGYRFIDNSNAELALFSYIHFGEESPGLLSGNFSYIIYDAMRRRIFAAVDDKASCPVFYFQNGDSTFLSSKPDSIFSRYKVSASLMPSGISRLLSASGAHYAEVFRGLKPISPSHFLKISNSGISEMAYTKNCENPSPCDIIKKHLRKNPQKIGVISVNTQEDSRLLELIFEQDSTAQLTVFSPERYDYLKNYPLLWQKINFTDDSVFSALEYAVSVCGMPYFSGYDFLLAQLLRRNFRKDTLLFTAFGGKYTDSDGVFEKNNALHTPVSESLVPCTPSDFVPCTPQILADSLDICSAEPFYDSPIIHMDFAKTQLRHILLSIIAKDTSPILAFYKRGALLRLCEGGFDRLHECALLEYLIKLNIWLEKFRPILL